MPPSRASIAFNLLLIILCAASAVGCVVRGDWWWAAVAAGCVGFLVWELRGDLAERQYYRPQ